MGGHETIGQNVHVLVQILFDVLQEVEIVLPLEEDRLAVVAAVVEVIILIREERRFAAGHDRLLAPLDFRSLEIGGRTVVSAITLAWIDILQSFVHKVGLGHLKIQ